MLTPKHRAEEKKYNVRVQPSLIPGGGSGLFAAKTFKKDEAILPYEGKAIQHAADEIPEGDYMLQTSPTSSIDSSDPETSNIARYANSGKTLQNSNAEFRKGAIVTALKKIPRDTEILVYYGKHFQFPTAETGCPLRLGGKEFPHLCLFQPTERGDSLSASAAFAFATFLQLPVVTSADFATAPETLVQHPLFQVSETGLQVVDDTGNIVFFANGRRLLYLVQSGRRYRLIMTAADPPRTVFEADEVIFSKQGAPPERKYPYVDAQGREHLFPGEAVGEQEEKKKKHTIPVSGGKFPIIHPTYTKGAQKVLVLGMAFVTPAGAEAAYNGAKGGASSATYRDVKRLRALERMGWDVLSISYGAQDVYWEEHKFFNAKMGRSSAKELANAATHFTIPRTGLDYIFGDYIRFPTTYLRQFYTSFLGDMLPELIKQDLVTVRTRIILPHARSQYAEGLYDRVAQVGAQIRYLHAPDYPLFMATEYPHLSQAHALGSTSNWEYVYGKKSGGGAITSALEPTAPFMEITFPASAITAIKTNPFALAPRR